MLVSMDSKMDLLNYITKMFKCSKYIDEIPSIFVSNLCIQISISISSEGYIIDNNQIRHFGKRLNSNGVINELCYQFFRLSNDIYMEIWNG